MGCVCYIQCSKSLFLFVCFTTLQQIDVNKFSFSWGTSVVIGVCSRFKKKELRSEFARVDFDASQRAAAFAKHMQQAPGASSYYSGGYTYNQGHSFYTGQQPRPQYNPSGMAPQFNGFNQAHPSAQTQYSQQQYAYQQPHAGAPQRPQMNHNNPYAKQQAEMQAEQARQAAERLRQRQEREREREIDLQKERERAEQRKARERREAEKRVLTFQLQQKQNSDVETKFERFDFSSENVFIFCRFAGIANVDLDTSSTSGFRI